MTTDLRHSSTSAATVWRLDPDVSSAEFHVRTFWGATTIHGHFERLDGAFEAGADGTRRMSLDIAAASLQTGNPRRDEHLRSEDFFDCERHPEVRFRSVRVGEIRDGRLPVEGELEAAGRRVPLRLEPTIARAGDDLEIHAEATVDQHELGMTSRRLGIRSPAHLTVHARLRPTDR
jgi:polyisoprenoid-binding protein YceI